MNYSWDQPECTVRGKVSEKNSDFRAIFKNRRKILNS